MREKNRNPLYLSVISFFISSMTVWFMPYGSFQQDGNQTLAYILAAAFWLFFVLGFVFLRPVSRQRKKDRKYKSNGGIALLRFFSNKSALIFDALLIAGIFTLILTFVIPTLPGWITTAAIFTALFSAEMHGVFNGRNYEYITKQ